MMCHKIGLPPISIIGSGRNCDSSLTRVPSPPANITAFNYFPLSRSNSQIKYTFHVSLKSILNQKNISFLTLGNLSRNVVSKYYFFSNRASYIFFPTDCVLGSDKNISIHKSMSKSSPSHEKMPLARLY